MFKSPNSVFYPAKKCLRPTIIGIFTFMSSINYMLSWVKHEKRFITSGPGIHYCMWLKACSLLSNCKRNFHGLDKRHVMFAAMHASDSDVTLSRP